MRAKCLNCDWQQLEGYFENELTQLAYEHHLEFGHDVEVAPEEPEDLEEARRELYEDMQFHSKWDEGEI